MSKVWFVTGAARGIGAEITKAALAAGHKVVATARQREAVEVVFGNGPDVLPVALDVTDNTQTKSAVEEALAHFGRIDVLVNNAGYGLLGAVEECTAEELSAQFATNVLGLAAVTRAVLPTMRLQRSGHIFNMSSAAGIVAFPGASAYCASKFAVEGLSESLSHEVRPLGIGVTIIEPGYMRTGFLGDRSLVLAKREIEDYAGTAGAMRAGSKAGDGQQPGDPRRLAGAIVKLAEQPDPPLRFVAGADCVDLLEQAMAARQSELERFRTLSIDMDIV